MAASTIPPSEWPALLYRPPATAAPPAVDTLPHMQLDDLHYSRQMLLCTGAGYSFSQCARILQPDTRTTTANPTEELYREEALATVTCLAENGGSREKCRYFMESWHKMLNPEEPAKPGVLEKAFRFSCKVLGVRSIRAVAEEAAPAREPKH